MELLFDPGLLQNLCNYVDGVDWHAFTSTCRELRRYAGFNRRFVFQAMGVGCVIPAGVTHLTLQVVREGMVVPDGVKELALVRQPVQRLFNGYFDGVSRLPKLPKSCTSLDLVPHPRFFDPSRCNVIPPQITHLTLEMNPICRPLTIPDTVTHLVLKLAEPQPFKRPASFDLGCLPKKLVELRIEGLMKVDGGAMRFPDTLIDLDLSCQIISSEKYWLVCPPALKKLVVNGYSSAILNPPSILSTSIETLVLDVYYTICVSAALPQLVNLKKLCLPSAVFTTKCTPVITLPDSVDILEISRYFNTNIIKSSNKNLRIVFLKENYTDIENKRERMKRMMYYCPRKKIKLM